MVCETCGWGSVHCSLDEPIGDVDRSKTACFKQLSPLGLIALTAIDERKHYEVDHLRVVG